jgi:hypothetical protein
LFCHFYFIYKRAKLTKLEQTSTGYHNKIRAYLKTPEWCKFKEGKKYRPIGHTLQPDAEVVPLWSSISCANIVYVVIDLVGYMPCLKSLHNSCIGLLILVCCDFKEAQINGKLIIMELAAVAAP